MKKTKPGHFIRRHRHDGFTLLEVLVALMIFATVSVMLYSQISSSAKTLERLEEKNIAIIIAKNRFSELMMQRKL